MKIDHGVPFRKQFLVLALSIGFACGYGVAFSQEDVSVESMVTPMNSVSGQQAKTFQVPAPRGMIVARGGEPLAISEVKHRLVARLLGLGENEKEVMSRFERLAEAAPSIPWSSVSGEEIARHLQHRSWVPFPVTANLSEESLAAVKGELLGNEAIEFSDCFSLEAVYERSYPEGDLLAHVIGYVGDALPDQHGPVGKVEYLWPPSVGRAGLELSLNEGLSGAEGQLDRLYGEKGRLLHQQIGQSPKMGDTLVLSINLEMQRKAQEALEKSGRPGAFVAVDADTGDILALVSYPSFDPNLFIGGIPETTYRELADREDAPFFDRAILGEYPPGSTFKPFVVLAGMDSGFIDGIETKFPGPAVMTIADREFKNWSKKSEGPMDLRYALTRSCNTWFYQAALEMGAHPIADVSRRFGFGAKPDLPLPASSSGYIPDPVKYGDDASLANFSIGQGRVLSSPLQMALAMAGLANGEQVPKPRLVLETLDPITNEIVTRSESEAASELKLDVEQLSLVHDGMWGVVNHGRGTAGRASMSKPVVYGKTGTSEWAVDGEKRSLAWFTGWVDAENPRIAFAAITQGRKGEMLSGGRSAAPIASTVLRSAYQNPELYAVSLPSKPSRSRPSLAMPEPTRVVVRVEPQEIIPVRRSKPRGLLQAIFGRRPKTPANYQPVNPVRRR